MEVTMVGKMDVMLVDQAVLAMAGRVLFDIRNLSQSQ
jgi:hypothetical protein